MAIIKINRQNFFHNLNQIALKTGSIDKISVVLKDNAYGHGLKIMAKLANEFGVKNAVVKNMKEAEEIREFFDTVLILKDKIIFDNVYTFAINTLEDIASSQSGARVELKVDTGMHRNGIAMNELDKALKLIEKYNLNLVAVMTHFRAADELSSELFWQQKNFELVKESVRENGYKNVKFHSHNSAAVLRTENFHEDMVRVGIAIYGYCEMNSIFNALPLKPVLTLHAEKSSTRELKKSQRVGYGGDYIAQKDMIVSTYDIGYGDGWERGNSKEPYTTADGLTILGRVSMDFISLESQRDEVLVMDNAQKASKHFGTISYEIVTALSKDIKRVVLG
jgi:alanine racemase